MGVRGGGGVGARKGAGALKGGPEARAGANTVCSVPWTAEETCAVCEANGCACGGEACCGSECIGSWSPVRRALLDVPLLLLLPVSMPARNER